jgi:hypothetical protein
MLNIAGYFAPAVNLSFPAGKLPNALKAYRAEASGRR